MTVYDLILALAASMAAGFINAVAGGGTLVTFPALLAMGLAPVTANVTNTVALTPGYFGGIWAQRKDFAKQKRRLFLILPLGILGGIAGGLILLNTGEKAFNGIVPWLILLACLLLAIQVPLKNRMQARSGLRHSTLIRKTGAAALLLLAAIYGGYFGAGVSVIVIAILGLIFDDPLTSLNVLKQAISFSINISATLYFIFSGKVEWTFALVMIPGSIAGGLLGGTFAGRIRPGVLRWIVVIIGIIVAIYYLIRNR